MLYVQRGEEFRRYENEGYMCGGYFWEMVLYESEIDEELRGK